MRAFWTWTVLCVVGTLILIGLIPTETTYKIDDGFTLVLSGNDIVNVTKTITIEMVSEGPFVIWNPQTGEAITAVPETPPLGWSGNYFRMEPTQLKEGTWRVKRGSSVTARITGAIGEVIVGRTAVGKFYTLVLELLIGGLVWCCGLAIGYGIGRTH